MNSDGGNVDRLHHTLSGNSAYDELFESDQEYGDINSGNCGAGGFYLTPTPTSSGYGELPEWTPECGDSYNYTASKVIPAASIMVMNPSTIAGMIVIGSVKVTMS